MGLDKTRGRRGQRWSGLSGVYTWKDLGYDLHEMGSQEASWGAAGGILSYFLEQDHLAAMLRVHCKRAR